MIILIDKIEFSLYFYCGVQDEHYMRMALEEAKKGWPKVAPNPMVGCVIVQNNEVIAKAFHERFGNAHAEVNAIAQLSASINASECTIYVSLEPCSHFGKTPPCSDLIIKKGFKKIVIAGSDPNPLVAGYGLKKLQKAGVDVTVGILEKEAEYLNRRFFCFHKNKRPYIVLKWAATADGFISRMPLPPNRKDNLISGNEATTFVHGLRAESQAIMVGKNTVLADNPNLTTRLVSGENPLRIIVDKSLEIPSTYNVFNEEAQTIIINGIKEEESKNVSYVKFNFSDNFLKSLMDLLYQKNIQSLLVEGGSILLNQFIEKGLWNEALIIKNPDLKFGTGILAPKMESTSASEPLGTDQLFRYYR